MVHITHLNTRNSFDILENNPQIDLNRHLKIARKILKKKTNMEKKRRGGTKFFQTSKKSGRKEKF